MERARHDPPVLTVPPSVVADATGPAGAVVSYSASALDDVDGPVAVACTPPSGATFAIGRTTVSCEAFDGAGNRATASFEVYVKGAQEQLDDQIGAVAGVGPGSSLADKLIVAQASLERGDIEGVCDLLVAFANEVRAQSGRALTQLQASELVATAQRVRAVLSC